MVCGVDIWNLEMAGTSRFMDDIDVATNSSALGILSSSSEDRSRPSRVQQFQSAYEEKTALFRRGGNDHRRRTQTTAGRGSGGGGTNFTTARRYGRTLGTDNMNAFRNQQHRGRLSNNRGRGAAGRPYSYGRNNHRESTASTSRLSHGGPAREPKIVCRDVYLVDVDVTNAPRGAKRAPLFQNGQVKTAFKMESTLGERDVAERIESEFSNILDLSKPFPR